MYVGITRAQRSLTVSWCKKRRRAREVVAREVSRFVAEMKIDEQGPADRDAAHTTPKARLDGLMALLAKPRAG